MAKYRMHLMWFLSFDWSTEKRHLYSVTYWSQFSTRHAYGEVHFTDVRCIWVQFSLYRHYIDLNWTKIIAMWAQKNKTKQTKTLLTERKDSNVFLIIGKFHLLCSDSGKKERKKKNWNLRSEKLKRVCPNNRPSTALLVILSCLTFNGYPRAFAEFQKSKWEKDGGLQCCCNLYDTWQHILFWGGALIISHFRSFLQHGCSLSTRGMVQSVLFALLLWL